MDDRDESVGMIALTGGVQVPPSDTKKSMGDADGKFAFPTRECLRGTGIVAVCIGLTQSVTDFLKRT